MFDATMNTFDVFKHYYNNSEGFMKKDYPRYTLRVSKEMLFKLAFVADFYGRSKNREIEYMIKNILKSLKRSMEKFLFLKNCRIKMQSSR